MTSGRKPSGEREPMGPNPSGPAEPVRAVRDTLFTRRHAEMLFDQVADLLGGEAWVETQGGGTRRSLFRRETPDAHTIAPWPVLSLGLGGRLSTVIPIMGPPGAPTEPPPRPGKAPRLRGLGPGEIVIRDGSRSVTITYGEDGRWIETSRGGDRQTLAAVVPALARKSAQPVELLAGFVAGLDPRKNGPGLTHLPAPLPGGVAGAFHVGVFAIRRALFTNRIPENARFVVADGYEGRAMSLGPPDSIHHIA